MSVIDDLARAAHDADGVAPFNEATLLALAAGDVPRLHLVDEVSAAVAFGDSPAELVVHPEHRRRGVGRELLERALVEDATAFWAHGELPGARALATSAGLSPARTLLVLRLDLGDEAPVERVPDGVTLRSFRPEDTDAVVTVNGRAFATHPEQGAMDRADFERRASSSWFDPAGLFVAERDGEVVGFHWTKVEEAADGERLGEVYVVGVDPSAHGGGLGSALTARGLRFMHEQGIRTVDLYVEADNEPALRTYHRLGFVEHARDTLFTTPER
ncbi:hypothetical protein ASD11_01555 [Aeromicrobium sp. Root495]|uniref:mycothiol synthase n=1 Tax=Aeromicrobium sp. Root495 TaxID=1736550 RepID=UPI0006F1CB8B|nr:mycothiol synthase [Aeromicrobium sp. Root495]KQY58378.1 hypothetical protein ASD11_01555 [Aeromicrobium sp. Root495]